MVNNVRSLFITSRNGNNQLLCCSIKGEELLYCKESNSDFRHSDYLHLFIEEALSNANVKINELNGVGVSMGPDLHVPIGVSSAKGICYANDIPLMAVNSLL